MRCVSCNSENLESSELCSVCNRPLPQLCATCGAVSPPGFKFCGQCGQRIQIIAVSPEPAATEQRHSMSGLPEEISMNAHTNSNGERKTITALFADIQG